MLPTTTATARMWPGRSAENITAVMPTAIAAMRVQPGVTFNIYKLCCGGGQFSDAWYQAALTRGGNSNISNNSWGGGNGVYTTASRISDFAVRGAYGNYMNMVIISHNDNALSRAPAQGKTSSPSGR